MADNDWIPLATAAALVEDNNSRWRQEIRRALMVGKVRARGVTPPGMRSEIPTGGKLVMIPARKFANLGIRFTESRLCPDERWRVTVYADVQVRRGALTRHARRWSECEGGAAENARAIAKSYFEEPRWPLQHALNWIGCRKIEALTLKPEELDRLRYHATIGEDGTTLVVKSPKAELLRAFKEGKLAAIGLNHSALPPEFWDARTTDLRTWGWVRFRREDMLRLWPPNETAGDTQAAAPLADTTTKPRRKRAPALAQQLTRELKIMYPDGRPAKSVKEIGRELEKRPNIGAFGPRTLEEALRRAWPGHSA